jgi:hypothetical protein
MNNMHLSKHNLITRFYMWTYGKTEEYLPKDFCSYFWSVLFATLILPLTIWSWPIQHIKTFDLDQNTDWTWAGRCGVLVFAFIFGVAGYGMVLGVIIHPWIMLGVFISAALITLGMISVVIGKGLLGEATHLLKAKTDSVKDKYCPVIEWKD